MICENRKCDNFKPIPRGYKSDAPYVKVQVRSDVFGFTFKQVVITRYLYRERLGLQFYYCDACHNAVQFVLGKH